MISSKGAKVTKYLPVVNAEAPSPQEEAPTTTAAKTVSEPVVAAETNTVASQEREISDLNRLQLAMSNYMVNNQRKEIPDLAKKIYNTQLTVKAGSAVKPEVDCLHYLVTVANDLSKLIHHIKTVNQVDDLSPYFKKSCANITDFCLDYFEHLVVNETVATAQ